jgi:hypothetical protein
MSDEKIIKNFRIEIDPITRDEVIKFEFNIPDWVPEEDYEKFKEFVKCELSDRIARFMVIGEIECQSL